MLNGLLMPFLGTMLGSACVFFLRGEMPDKLRRGLSGFAAGVMTAASIWSLLLPSLESSGSWFPAVSGFWFGILFLLLLDHIIPHFHMGSNEEEGPRSSLDRNIKMVLAVTLHNIPEGLAVGVLYGGLKTHSVGITAAAAFSLALGIALQNFPEGAIISMPLHANGMGRWKAFLLGTLSGLAEPLAFLGAVAFAAFTVPVLPYCLGFAAGAMMYVTVEELIPEMAEGSHWNGATLCFTLGFTLMIILDTVLG